VRQDGLEEVVMSWLVLVISGVLEAVWAVALGRSDGLTKLVPSVVFGIAAVLSMGGLAWAMRDLPTGTAYAVWVGIGAALTVGYSMATGADPVTPLRVLFLAMIVGGVVGLKLVH
jgi:quaternary ammonium compound-resistance protein SugE